MVQNNNILVHYNNLLAQSNNILIPNNDNLQNHTNNRLTINHSFPDGASSNIRNPRNTNLPSSGQNSHPPELEVDVPTNKSNLLLFNTALLSPIMLDAIPMIHSPEPCADDIYLVTFVHSAVGNSGRRTLIRSTWAKPQANVKTIFILGTESHVKSVAIASEAEQFKYIAQFGFLDTYRDLTWKHLMGLQWVKTFCKHARYLLKSDDDVIVNTKSVLHTLNTAVLTSGIYCEVCHKHAPMRDVYDKNHVTEAEYPRTMYPDFCKGFTYLVSTRWLP